MISLDQPKWLVVGSASLFLCGAVFVAASLRTEQRAKALPRMSCQDLILRDGLGMIVLATACQLGWSVWRRFGRFRESVTRELVGGIGK
jgi:hypothetical protein